ncbi:homocysteine S-methyltransferase family protein [Aliiglaciecola sp. M165]|uniref:homocysteine S-methyltransferase family protein n=1 Tax=Aliiglaciecola sp. M165 TaxID=2593649 RepID=UPI001C8F54EE|nr:homocysteine S-methyltransferase family protein [Aliiglaciecola sp. M165]
MTNINFPESRPNTIFLTEGGIETEIMYKWGFDLPHFAMFPLLENPEASETIKNMYRRYLDVVAKYGHNALIGGFDYRASPDYGKALGYSEDGLREANMRSIQFLRDVAAEYNGQIDQCLFTGYVGPRGDAYFGANNMSIEESEQYHSVQIETLKAAGVDLVWAVTFSHVQEAIGVVRAAKKIGLPIAISFTLTSEHKLSSGLSFSSAIKIVDAQTAGYPSFFSINCSHPDEFGPALSDGEWMHRVRSLRPNAAKMDKISLCKLGHLEEGNPVELGIQIGELKKRYEHMDIWGGCCGTCETHLEEMAKNLPSGLYKSP